MGPIYRDPGDGLRRLRAELFERRWAELDSLPRELQQIYARRVARITAGAVAFAGMAVVFLVSLASVSGGPFRIELVSPGALGIMTVGAWALVAIAYAAAWITAALRFPRHVLRMLDPSGELHRDVAELGSATMQERVARWIARYELPSAAWPLAGAAMIVPLFLHFGVYALHIGGIPSVERFGFWIALSTVTVAHCHLVLAFCGWRFAHELAAAPSASFEQLDARGLRALGVTTVSSLLPGLLLAGIPCLLVAVTGLVFVPAAFWSVVTRVRRERLALEGFSGPLSG